MVWPFGKKQQTALEPMLDNDEFIDLCQLNKLNPKWQRALTKAIDINHLQQIQNGDDTGGMFGSEFELGATAGRLKALYTREPWLNAGLDQISKNMITVPLKVHDPVTLEELPNHPLNQQLKSSSPLGSEKQRELAGNIDLTSAGNYFLVFDENYERSFHVPVEMTNMKMQDGTNEDEIMRVGPIKELQVTNYMGQAFPMAAKSFPFEHVVHFKLPNPYNPFFGLSLVTAASRPILLDRYKNEFEMAFYLRGATHSGVIETTEDISKTRMERLMRTFEASMTGKRNWWRQLFLPKGAKWVTSGLTMSEMQHLEGLRENRLTLLAVMGVPPSQLGIVQDVNRATAETQETAFWQNTIIPLSELKADGWNASYLVRVIYGGEVVVMPDYNGIEAVEGSFFTKAEKAKAVENIATVNEQREIVGLEPKPQYDKLFIEVQQAPLASPFGTVDSVDTDTDGGDNEEKGMVRVQLSDGDGDNRHTHTAEIDENTGEGRTIDTQGDGPAHDHEIKKFEPQEGGEDNHSHARVDPDIGQQLKFIRNQKQAAAFNQGKIERQQGEKVRRVFNRYTNTLLKQAATALRTGRDVRAHMITVQDEREQAYKGLLEILEDTVNKGYDFAAASTRSLSNAITKATTTSPRFSTTDELALAALRERTKDGQRRLLAERQIEVFKSIDNVAVENVMRIIEDGLEQGKTNLQIAGEIAETYRERHPSAADTVVRTEVLSAVSQGLKWQQENLQQVFTKVNKQWFHIGDGAVNPDARQGHVQFEQLGQVEASHIYVNEVTGASLRFPRDFRGGAGDVINCRCSMTNVVPPDAQSNASAILEST